MRSLPLENVCLINKKLDVEEKGCSGE